jgi:hypothetical protein
MPGRDDSTLGCGRSLNVNSRIQTGTAPCTRTEPALPHQDCVKTTCVYRAGADRRSIDKVSAIRLPRTCGSCPLLLSSGKHAGSFRLFSGNRRAHLKVNVAPRSSWVRLFLDSGFEKERVMHSEWLAMEHYRIHLMESWPDGPRKEAGLASARSGLESLARTVSEGSSFACSTCAGRQTVTEIPCAPRIHRLPSGMAA